MSAKVVVAWEKKGSLLLAMVDERSENENEKTQRGLTLSSASSMTPRPCSFQSALSPLTGAISSSRLRSGRVAVAAAAAVVVAILPVSCVCLRALSQYSRALDLSSHRATISLQTASHSVGPISRAEPRPLTTVPAKAAARFNLVVMASSDARRDWSRRRLKRE
jgi:hypothetical protein